jgi:oligopeptide transport system permease protein
MAIQDTEEAVLAAQSVQGRSLWQDARRRLFANAAAVTSMVILAIIAVLAVAVPLVSPHPYDKPYFDRVSCPPPDYFNLGVIKSAFGDQNTGACEAAIGQGHWFGTDANGRDLFVRTFIGARVSLSIGVTATGVALIIGVLYGATAGFLGGRVDNLMMRFVDILYALPFIFFVIILMVVFGRNFILMFVAIGAVEWLTMARIVRGQTLSIRRKEFIEAAVAAGVSDRTIILRHILPNVIGPVIVFVTLTVPAVILAESFLSFLGLGVQEPLTSWGVLIADGAQQMQSYPWMLVFPALMLSITLFCFNFIGDGLRDALDPKDR